MLKRALAAFRERRERVKRDATDLLTFLGDMAYDEARTRARESRVRGDRDGHRHWSRVAVCIAPRIGKTIGESTADRYHAASSAPISAPVSRELATSLVAISQDIADLAHGRAHAMTLHNVGARVRQIIEAAGSTPALVLAGDDVIAACERLACRRVESATEMSAGIYPTEADAAGKALQRLRAAAAVARPIGPSARRVG